MERALIIAAISILAIVASVFAPKDTKDDYKGILGFNCLLWTVVFILAIIVLVDMKAPSALDVYRGNTELEIHSVNGVPTDTVIVYKKNL